ncbi:MAG: rhodanese-like domain-containing protein [Gemmobacter sp.]
MSRAVQQMLAEANAAVPRIEAAAAQALIAQRGALLLGTRDAPELEKMGRAEGSHHIPRGMLEFRADPASPFHDPALRKDRPVVLHCASGGRAALAGKLLRDMGYAEVWNLGGLKDWKDGGGPVVEPVDQGM